MRLNITDSFLYFLSLLLLILAILGAIFIFTHNFNTPYQHFTQQAVSFIHGRTDIPQPDHDASFVNGKYYWVEGPFPSVLLMPFVAISPIIFHQGSLQLLLILVSIFLLIKLSLVKGFNFLNSIFLSCVFLLGSTVVGLIVDPKSWFYAQVVAITFLLGLIYEFETRRRWWLIGILEGCLIATRPTAGFIIFYLLIWIALQKSSFRNKFSQLLQLAIPIGLSLIGLFALNYSRFGNIFDNGYGSNDIGGYLEPLRQMGMFSLSHIPANLYYYFLESVEPVLKNSQNLVFPFIKYNGWGLSFFLVSPFFIYAFKGLKKYKLLWLVVGITLLNLLTYYAPGWVQFGPRYTADFMPVLFLILLQTLNGKLTQSQKLIISLSCFFNIYLLFTATFVPTPM